MTTDTTISAFRHPDAIEDPLTSVLRDGARRLLAEAIEAEAEVFLAAMPGSFCPPRPWPGANHPDGHRPGAGSASEGSRPRRQCW